MKKKIGLVIQGPLLSIGRTGDKLRQTPEQLIAEGGVIHYDCRDNIKRIINEFGNLFDEIVVSTWDNEVKTGDGWVGAKLISAPDPGGIKQANSYKDNNKFRQFLSTLNGLRELEKSGVDIAVKIRTDIYLDLNKLVEDYVANIESKKNPKAIYATVVHPATFLLHDLYFVSSLTAMSEFCESILGFDRFEFIPSVHREMVLKHAYKEYRNDISVPDWAYFPISPANGVNIMTRAIFDYMFKNVYFSLDPDLFKNTLWRGTYFDEKHVSFLIDEKTKVRKGYNIPAWLSVDWKRYFYFKKEITRREVTLIDRVVIMFGEFGWQSWIAFRRLGSSILTVVR